MRDPRNPYPDVEEIPDGFDDADRKSVQVVHIVGHTVCCRNCMKEIAAFYCPCGAFLCAFDMVAHKCLITLRQTFSKELTKALR
jgi:hypothetical protein